MHLTRHALARIQDRVDNTGRSSRVDLGRSVFLPGRYGADLGVRPSRGATLRATATTLFVMRRRGEVAVTAFALSDEGLAAVLVHLLGLGWTGVETKRVLSHGVRG